MLTRKALRLFCCCMLGTGFACDGPITTDLEAEWRDRFRAALVSGYTEFRGLYVDGDTGVVAFRYRAPESLSADGVIPTVRARILSENSCFKVLKETGTRLQLRCGIETYGVKGFEEYQVCVDASTRAVAIMFGAFDSPAEQGRHPHFVDKFESLCRQSQ